MELSPFEFRSPRNRHTVSPSASAPYRERPRSGGAAPLVR